MKLVTFKMPQGHGPVSGTPRAGLIHGDHVLDLETVFRYASFSQNFTASNLALIQAGPQAWDKVRALLKEPVEKNPADAIFKLKDLELLSPITRPVSMRDGYAFRQHVEAARKGRGLEMIPEFDQFPVFYFTNPSTVTGPGDVPVQPKALDKLDFELEVAIVVGKAGKNIPASKADEHIFGYMILNDWSARALQRQEMTLSLGPAKGKDFANSLGPWLVTRDELESFRINSREGERFNLNMKCWHKGELVSEGNLKDMTWTFAQILERVSYGVRVEPGEVIGSGTVGTGCFMELNVTGKFKERWIQAGDSVVMEIDGLGRLENRVVQASEEYEG